MKTLLKYLAIVLVFIFSSCSEETMKSYESAEQMVEDAKANVEFISAEDLKSEIEEDAKIYILDCREEIEFDSACIIGAVNVPRGEAEFTISKAVPERRAKLIVYCSNGNRSTLLANVLPKMKFSNVKVLEGGFDIWKEQHPELVELEPVRTNSEKKSAQPPSGGCGG
jgi:rhodanese-related sulfurtransferase